MLRKTKELRIRKRERVANHTLCSEKKVLNPFGEETERTLFDISLPKLLISHSKITSRRSLGVEDRMGMLGFYLGISLVVLRQELQEVRPLCFTSSYIALPSSAWDRIDTWPSPRTRLWWSRWSGRYAEPQVYSSIRWITPGHDYLSIRKTQQRAVNDNSAE